MSWESYITNMREQSKDNSGVEHITKGGIYGMGGEEWASSPDFKVGTTPLPRHMKFCHNLT